LVDKKKCQVLYIFSFPVHHNVSSENVSAAKVTVILFLFFLEKSIFWKLSQFLPQLSCEVPLHQVDHDHG
jgi:hypothetical protein